MKQHTTQQALDAVLRAYCLSTDMFFVGIALAIDYPMQATEIDSTPALLTSMQGSSLADFQSGLRLQLRDPHTTEPNADSLKAAREAMNHHLKEPT